MVKLLSTNSSFSFIFTGGSVLKSTDGKVNILLLGIAGGNHGGANLTDTIMVASVDTINHNINLISIPRDLYLDGIKNKVNAVYETGLIRGQGLTFSQTMVGGILGIPIHYVVRVDFNGFIKAVDQIGGIDVNVDRAFDDYVYPITGKENELCGANETEKDFSPDEAKSLNIDPGKRKVFILADGKIATDAADEAKGQQYFSCRYEHISFNKGLVHMDGATALKFVRSRHGTNGEGSDFARSARQEKVITAFKSKILSLQTLTDASKISNLMATFGQSLDTNLNVTEGLELLKVTRKNEHIGSYVINGSSKLPLLINPPLGDYGAWVLIPKVGLDNFTQIQESVKDILNNTRRINESSASARTGN